MRNERRGVAWFGRATGPPLKGPRPVKGPTPDSGVGRNFVQRLGRGRGADKAAPNAARYPDGRGGRPGYAQVFQDVWVARRWPELCEALGG